MTNYKITEQSLINYIHTHPYYQNHYVSFKKCIYCEIDRISLFIQNKRNKFIKECENIGYILIEKKSSMNCDELQKVQKKLRKLSKFIKINKLIFEYLVNKDVIHCCNDQKNHILDRPKIKKKLKSFKKKSTLFPIFTIISNIKQYLRPKSGNTINNAVFCRKTDKYWVHKDNLECLKSLLIGYLPIYVFEKKETEDIKQNKNFEDSSEHILKPLRISSITSVYLDSPSYKTYITRLYKLQDSECIRFRWYDNNDNIIFIERKKHMDGWTGYESKKLRFKIKEYMVNKYLAGECIWEHVKEMNQPDGKSNDKYWYNLKILYAEIKHSIITHKLRPSIRTYYKRTAFQVPESNKIRLSLDEDLYMIKEKCDCFNNQCEKDNISSHQSCGIHCLSNNWRRPNLSFPFSSLSEKDLIKFPYGILELKTTTSTDQQDTSKIEELKNKMFYLVEHVHKFSKFLHGTAVLYDKEIVPYWIKQMGTGIRKENYYQGKGQWCFLGRQNKLIYIKTNNLRHENDKTEKKMILMKNDVNSIENNQKGENTSINLRFPEIDKDQFCYKTINDLNKNNKFNTLKKSFPDNNNNNNNNTHRHTCDRFFSRNNTIKRLDEVDKNNNMSNCHDVYDKFDTMNTSNQSNIDQLDETNIKTKPSHNQIRIITKINNSDSMTINNDCSHCNNKEILGFKKFGNYTNCDNNYCQMNHQNTRSIECIKGGIETDNSNLDGDWRGEDKTILIRNDKNCKCRKHNKHHIKNDKHKKEYNTSLSDSSSDSTSIKSKTPSSSSSTTILSSESTKSVKLSNIKRIAIPIRVEPKVFFANERTFLSWLHFNIFIGGLGSALVGLGDTKAVISGSVFIIVSTIFAIYALYLYMWRARRIRERDPGPYDDLVGPGILVMVFVAAMGLSLIFKIKLH